MESNVEQPGSCTAGYLECNCTAHVAGHTILPSYGCGNPKHDFKGQKPYMTVLISEVPDAWELSWKVYGTRVWYEQTCSGGSGGCGSTLVTEQERWSNMDGVLAEPTYFYQCPEEEEQ